MTYGLLEVFCGPMFGGKSAALIRRMDEAAVMRPGEVIAVKPAYDTRFGAECIVTREGRSVPALAVSRWPELPAGTAWVFLDEIQFMRPPLFEGDLPAEVARLLAQGVNVTAAGLDTDWQGRAFETTGLLAAMADRVEKLRARCGVCGAPAGKTRKKSGSGDVFERGDGELYEPRCNSHWAA